MTGTEKLKRITLTRALYQQIRAWKNLQHLHTYSFWKADGTAYEITVFHGMFFHNGVNVTSTILSDEQCVWYHDPSDRRRGCI